MGTSGSAPDIPERDIMRIFAESEQPFTPMTTVEIAEEVDCPRERARSTLEELVERGELLDKDIDGSTRIWWPTNPETAVVPADKGQFGHEQFSAFIEAVEDYAIFLLDADGTVISWNDGAERIKGYTAPEIVGDHFSTFYTDRDVEDGLPERNLESAAEEGSTEDEGWRVRNDGTRFWADVTITAIRDDEGVLQGFTKVTRDMTDRREYERRLQEQADRLERQRDELERELDEVFERVDDAFYALDEEFRFTYVNDSAAEYFGASASELLGRSAWEEFDVDDDDPIVERYETAMATQEPVTFEHYSDPLGIWAVVRVYPSETGLSVYFRDITERKRTENELRKSEERFRAMMEHSPFSMQIFDEDGETIAANPAWERLWDAPREELDDYNVLEDEQLEDAGLRPYIEDAFAGEVVTLPIIHYDPAEIGKPGRDRWIEAFAYPLLPGGGERFEIALVHHDITDRKERERELQRIRERMEFALNSTDAIVWDWNVEEDRASFYPSEESLYGTTVDSWEDFLEVIHPEDREKVKKGIETALETGEPKHEEVRIVRNGEVRWIEAPGQPVQDDDGPVRMIGVVRDITDRKTFERKLAESNERLEQFAYIASHDLQEPLRTISNFLQLLEDRYGDELDADGHEYIDFAVDGADRMRAMIDDLLRYSRVESEAKPLKPTDTNEVVDTVLDRLHVQIEESHAEVVVDDLPTVMADGNQLEQVFQNLISNAIKYRGEGSLRIEIDADRRGDRWKIAVADNGIGIDPDHIDQIFDVFKRLHSDEEYPGTGIGLALCEKIVDRHGGEIWVESEPGQGSTFSFTIPTAD